MKRDDRWFAVAEVPIPDGYGTVRFAWPHDTLPAAHDHAATMPEITAGEVVHRRFVGGYSISPVGRPARHAQVPLDPTPGRVADRAGDDLRNWWWSR